MAHEKQLTRHLEWDACCNVRDLGDLPAGAGRRTRRQALVRSDNLHRLTEEGQAALRDYGVRTIIDLRLAYEVEMHPNPFAAGQEPGEPRYLNLPFHDPAIDAAIDGAQATQSEYILMVESSKEFVAAAIKAVVAGLEDGGVLVHCHGGKDRTGIIVGLLLSLAGVPREIILEDFALSEARLEASNMAWLEEQNRKQGQPVDKPEWMFARPEKLGGLLDYLDREYGGVESYLQAAGVTGADIARIQVLLVAPA
jgi:protein-tyrosine phosphatase